MKKLFVLFLFFVSTNIFAQKYSVDFSYLGSLNSKYIKSISGYSINADYFYEKYDLSAGLVFTAFRGEIDFKVLKHPSLLLETFKESSPMLGININYFPSFLTYKNYFKIYSGFGIGFSLSRKTFGYFDIMPASFEEASYSFSNSNYYYLNLNSGIIFFHKETFNLFFSLQYYLRNPEVTYIKVVYSDDNTIEKHEKYKETINLNMFLWQIGLRINF